MLCTRICDLLGIEHPIISAPMAGTSTAELAAAVSNAEAKALVSFLPPEKHTATQVPHPTASTFFLPFIIRLRSSKGFCSATIIF